MIKLSDKIVVRGILAALVTIIDLFVLTFEEYAE